jgi:TolB-like protein
MEGALLRALAKTPADRFPTVLLFAEALGRPSTITAAQRRRTLSGPVQTGRIIPWKQVAMVAGGLLVLGVGYAGLRTLRGGSHGALEGPDPRKIAVLYFQDRSPGHALGYVADGLTEALIHELASVSALKVISPNGVARFRGNALAPDSVARALSVGTIVSGSVDVVGDSLALAVSMSNGATGAEMASARLVAPRSNVLALQDTLAGEVSRVLRQSVGQAVDQLISRAGTGSKESWDLVQQAAGLDRQVESLLSSGDTAAAGRQLASADSDLARAARLDPGWTTPLIERGWIAWHQRHVVGFEKTAADQWTRHGLDFAERALAIRTDSAALHLRGTMRYVRWLLNLDPAPLTTDQLLSAAEQDLTAGGAALGNPRRADDLSLLSHLEARRSETAQAKIFAQQAYEADPYLNDANDIVWRLYSASLDLEDQREATRWCQEGTRRFPDDASFTECQISLFALKGSKPDIPHLWKLLDQNVQQYPPNERDFRRRRGSLLVAMALGNAGLKDSARAVALRARAGPDVDPNRELVYVEMLLRNVLGDRQESLTLLAQYLATNPQDRVTVANDHTWWLRGLRDDPKFATLVGAH